jgi:hypothetical protein
MESLIDNKYRVLHKKINLFGLVCGMNHNLFVLVLSYLIPINYGGRNISPTKNSADCFRWKSKPVHC